MEGLTLASRPSLIAGLLPPEVFSHPADRIELRETHISWVILAGAYAYKLKKPVNFGFLDFSTPEARRFDCNEEVRLNRRLCSDVYLGVVDVVVRNGEYFIGGEGEVLEPAVWMRRLPDKGMLSTRLARGTADARLMVRIARSLATFHASAATGAGVNEYASLASLRTNWAENFAQTTTTLDAAKREVIRTYTQQFLDSNTDLLESRLAKGCIRDGHGDLHAGSICSTASQLYLFDCIEFSPRLRCGDVAAEVAFVAMDLDHAGRADLAQIFVDAYIRASGDSQLPELLDFYKCYRAYVRGKVLALRLREPGLDPWESARISGEARAYFTLAQAYARRMPERLLVVTMGPPASGKTTLARALASNLGLLYLSSDVIRKQLAHVGLTEHHLDAFERGLYTRARTRRTYLALHKQAARWLRSGRSVVLDATFGTRAERAAMRQLARRSGARLIVFRCRADEAVLQARLASRPHGDPRSSSDARLELWPALRAAFVEPIDLPEVISIDTTQPVDQTIHAAVSELLATRPSEAPPLRSRSGAARARRRVSV